MASIRITRDPEVAILDLGSPEKNPWSGSPDLIRDLKQQAELMYQEGTLEEGYTPYPDIRDLATAADALQLSYTITYPTIRKPRETEPGPGIRYEPPRDFIDPQTWFELALGESSKVFFNPYHDKRGRFTFKKGSSVTSLSPEGPRPNSGPGINRANFPQRGKEFETIQRQAKAYGWSVDEYRQTIDMISDRFTPDDVIAGRSLGALQVLYKARSETIQRILPRLVLGDGALITPQEALSHLQKQAVLNQTVLAKKIRSLGGVVPGEGETRPPVTPPTTPGTRGGATSLSDYNRPFVKAFTDGLNPGWHRSKEAKEVGHSVAESRDFSGGALTSGLTARFGIRVLPSLMNPGQFEWSVTPHFFEKGVIRGSTKYHGGESTLQGGTILGTIKGVASGVNAAKIAAEEAFETARRLLAGDGSLPVNIASTSPLFTLPKHGSTPTITAPTVVRPPTVTPPTITAPTTTASTTTPPVATSTTRPKAGTFTGGTTNPGRIRKESLTDEIFGPSLPSGQKPASELAILIQGKRSWEARIGASASLETALQAVIDNPKIDRVIASLEKTVKGFADRIRDSTGYLAGRMVSSPDQIAAHRKAILEGLGVDPKVMAAFSEPGGTTRRNISDPSPPGSGPHQPDAAIGLENVGGEPTFIGGMRQARSGGGPGVTATRDEIRMTEDNRGRALEGINFIRAVMSVGHPESGMEIATIKGRSLTTSRKLPPVKIGTMYDDPDDGQVNPVEGGRAYYRVGHRTSLTNPDLGPGMYLEGRSYLRTGRIEETAAHEYGHHLEFHLQDAPVLIEKFYQRRTVGEPLVSLKSLFPGSAYGPDETTKLDKFPNPYMGSRDSNPYPGGSEVLSTALGSLYANPVKLYRDDPELFRLAIGILIRQ